MPNPLCPSTMLLTVGWGGLNHSTRLQVSSAQHLCTFRHWLQGVPVFRCDAEKCRTLQKFYILVSICTCVFREANSQLFLASDTKWMHGKFDFCTFSRTVFLYFTSVIQLNIFSMWFTASETHGHLAAMLSILLGHQLINNILLLLLPLALLSLPPLLPFWFWFSYYISACIICCSCTFHGTVIGNPAFTFYFGVYSSSLLSDNSLTCFIFLVLP